MWARWHPTHVLQANKPYYCITSIFNLQPIDVCSIVYVPPDWKMAVITPVYKTGASSHCCNYRPISVTCVISKHFEPVVANVADMIWKIKRLHSSIHWYDSDLHSYLTFSSQCLNMSHGICSRYYLRGVILVGDVFVVLIILTDHDFVQYSATLLL